MILNYGEFIRFFFKRDDKPWMLRAVEIVRSYPCEHFLIYLMVSKKILWGRIGHSRLVGSKVWIIGASKKIKINNYRKR